MFSLCLSQITRMVRGDESPSISDNMQEPNRRAEAIPPALNSLEHMEN